MGCDWSSQYFTVCPKQQNYCNKCWFLLLITINYSCWTAQWSTCYCFVVRRLISSDAPCQLINTFVLRQFNYLCQLWLLTGKFSEIRLQTLNIVDLCIYNTTIILIGVCQFCSQSWWRSSGELLFCDSWKLLQASSLLLSSVLVDPVWKNEMVRPAQLCLGFCLVATGLLLNQLSSLEENSRKIISNQNMLSCLKTSKQIIIVIQSKIDNLHKRNFIRYQDKTLDS